MDEQRAEFEAWQRTRRNGSTVWWDVWQAATQRQQERIAYVEKIADDAIELGNQQAIRIAELEAALNLARGEVAYMASGMTHANWKTMEAQRTLDVIDAAIQKATHKEKA